MTHPKTDGGLHYRRDKTTPHYSQTAPADQGMPYTDCARSKEISPAASIISQTATSTVPVDSTIPESRWEIDINAGGVGDRSANEG